MRRLLELNERARKLGFSLLLNHGDEIQLTERFEHSLDVVFSQSKV